MNCSGHPVNPRLLFDASDYLSGDQHSVMQCTSCGLAYTRLAQATASTDEFYPDSYYGKEQRYSSLAQRLLNFLVQRRAGILKLSASDPGRVLDIGCGQGWLLKYFEELGWSCTGTELSPQAAWHARQVLGLSVLTGADSTQSLDAGSFDVICLWHVLEHVPAPEKLLNEVYRLLKPGGRLLLGIPNFGSCEARLSKDKWFHLDVPRHLIHFNRATISRMLGDSGLRIRKIKHLVPEYDFFSFVQSMQNRLGIRTNLLYSILRKGELAGEPIAKRFHLQKLMVLLSTPILAAIALIWVPLMNSTGQGSSFIILVEKPSNGESDHSQTEC